MIKQYDDQRKTVAIVSYPDGRNILTGFMVESGCTSSNPNEYWPAVSTDESSLTYITLHDSRKPFSQRRVPQRIRRLPRVSNITVSKRFDRNLDVQILNDFDRNSMDSYYNASYTITTYNLYSDLREPNNVCVYEGVVLDSFVKPKGVYWLKLTFKVSSASSDVQTSEYQLG